jgi:hypothetical protein
MLKSNVLTNRSYITTSLVLITVLFFNIFLPISTSALSNGSADYDIVDYFIAVDHPPFQQEYSGDGYSYLNVGISVPLQHFQGVTVTGTVEGNNSMVEAIGQVDDMGRVLLSFPLYSYGNYEIVIYDENGLVIFEEAVMVDSQEGEFNIEQLEPSPLIEVESEPESEEVIITEPEIEIEPEPETVLENGGKTETVPEPDREPVTETESPSETESEPVVSITDSEGKGIGIWMPLIGLGIGLGVIGLFLTKSKPCKDKFLAWQKAEQLRKEKRAIADKAKADADNASAARAEIEAELSEIRQKYPSAGKPGGDESWIESEGRRITGRDIELRREAERAAYEKYRENPNPETAKKLEEEWKESASPESEAERKEIEERAKDLERRLNESIKEEQNAIKKADEAEKAAEKAAENADAARRAYEECIGSTTSGTDGDTPGSGTSIGTEEQPSQTKERPCSENEPPQERNIIELGTVTLPVQLKVRLDGCHAHAAAVTATDISEQLSDASETLGWLSSAMDLKGIGSALIRDRSGWKMLGESIAPGIGKVTGTPIPTSPLQAGVDILSFYAKIAGIIVKKVPELQDRRLNDCTVYISDIRRTMRATCSEIWVCKNGQWVFDEKRFTLTLIREVKSGERKFENITWAQAQEEIEKWENIQMNKLKRALDELADMESRCS